MNRPPARPRTLVVGAIGSALVLSAYGAWTWRDAQAPRTAQLRLGTGIVQATVADTPERRSWGLQGRPMLAEDSGMLFVYPTPQLVRFETKTVPFPIDVVFIGTDGRVARIARLDAASTVATSPVRVRYVVEVSAGWPRTHGLTVRSPAPITVP